ncbi:hypothetical protein ACFCV8_04055 [Streptomyces sp. NPDC056347]|uniref:hypothetical protein n=1 Tax=Streptomyces sp. NPDC056347 TaxID=3345790 RepID=UPI0035D782F2
MTPSAGRRATPVPYAALGGFLLLLVALFSVSYGVGRLAGPVAPDMRGVTRQDDPPAPHDMGGTDGTGGTDDMGGMGH